MDIHTFSPSKYLYKTLMIQFFKYFPKIQIWLELLLGPDGRAGCRGAECWRVRDRSWEESEHSVGTAQPHRSQLSLSHFFQPWFICGVISFGEQSVLSGLQQEKKKNALQARF